MLYGKMLQGQMLHGQMLHGQMLHGQMLHGQILHGQMLHGQMLQGQMLHGQMFHGTGILVSSRGWFLKLEMSSMVLSLGVGGEKLKLMLTGAGIELCKIMLLELIRGLKTFITKCSVTYLT